MSVAMSSRTQRPYAGLLLAAIGVAALVGFGLDLGSRTAQVAVFWPVTGGVT